MSNGERYTHELRQQAKDVVIDIITSEAWDDLLTYHISEDSESLDVHVREWARFGVTPENEEYVMNELADITVDAIPMGNDPTAAGDGFFGYFLTIYQNERLMKEALARMN